MRKSQQEALGETLQCATQRRVCRPGVGDPHHGQVTVPGDGGRARCGVHRRPHRHRDVQPTRSEVGFSAAARLKSAAIHRLTLKNKKYVCFQSSVILVLHPKWICSSHQDGAKTLKPTSISRCIGSTNATDV